VREQEEGRRRREKGTQRSKRRAQPATQPVSQQHFFATAAAANAANLHN